MRKSPRVQVKGKENLEKKIREIFQKVQGAT